MLQSHRPPTYDGVGCTICYSQSAICHLPLAARSSGPALRPLGRVCAPVVTEYREFVVAAGLVLARAHGEAPNGQSHCER